MKEAAGSVLLATIAEIIGCGAILTFYTESFPTRFRASGASARYQSLQVYGGGLIAIVAGQILRADDVKDAYMYIGALVIVAFVMVYAVLAILAILRTPETKGTNLEIDAAVPYRAKHPLPVVGNAFIERA